jgi:hypothetical protein
VRDWKRLDYALPVSVILALVLASVNGMILLRVTDAKVDLNVSVTFLLWMDIVQNASCWNVLVIHRFVPPAFPSMIAIVIKLTNHNHVYKS